MRIRNLKLVTALLLAASMWCGCAETRKLVIADPVGPTEAAKQASGTKGSLVVYSAWDGLDTLDSEHRKHTAYTVRSQQGVTVLHVRNRCGSFEGEPQVVDLPPGRYWIESDATNMGAVQIAAAIRKGETTVVYLDGTTRPAGPPTDETNWIRQPNGLIIGWKDQGLCGY